LAKVVAETAVRLAVPMRRPGFDTIALSGGCFQNRLLLESVAARLGAAGFAVLCHSEVPSNDGGLAPGQAAIGAARLIGG
jgi:hydrogenase maturation protein HypF